MAQEHQAHLTLLHVIEHHKIGELVRPEELEAAALDRLRALVAAEAELWCEPRATVRYGAPGEKILEVAEKEEADLVVLGVRKDKAIVRATHLPAAVASDFTCNLPSVDGSDVRSTHIVRMWPRPQ